MSQVDSPVPFLLVESGIESQSSPESDEISAKFRIVPVASVFIVNRIVRVVSPPVEILAIFLVARFPD